MLQVYTCQSLMSHVNRRHSPNYRFTHATAPCYRFTHATAPCYRFTHARALCYRLTYGRSPCYRFTRATAPCYRFTHAWAPCHRFTGATAPCYRFTHAAGPCCYRFAHVRAPFVICLQVLQQLYFVACFCADVDECAYSKGRCHQVCVNTVGSYTCNCTAPYFTLNRNGYSCDGRLWRWLNPLIRWLWGEV